MKWYAYILIIVGFGLGWLVHWYHAALACPLCLCPSRSVDQSYMDFWLQLFDRYAIPAGVGLLALAAVALAIVAVPLYGMWLRRR